MEFKQYLQMNRLFDYYGALLTDKQKKLFELYYIKDLSLTEISENEKISKQGAQQNIRRSAEFLSTYEDALGLIAKTELRAKMVEQILQKEPQLRRDLQALLDVDTE